MVNYFNYSVKFMKRLRIQTDYFCDRFFGGCQLTGPVIGCGVRFTTEIFGIAEAVKPEGASMDAAEFARTRLGLDADERQTEVLRSDTKRGILNCSRQWGKSTVAAVKAVHRAYTRPESLVLVASPSDRQSTELLKKAKGMVRRLGLRPCGDGGADPSLLFGNGSRI